MAKFVKTLSFLEYTDYDPAEGYETIQDAQGVELDHIGGTHRVCLYDGDDTTLGDYLVVIGEDGYFEVPRCHPRGRSPHHRAR